MIDLINKTKDYIKAFDQRNLQLVTNFFAENAILFDPANPNGVKGQKNISAMIASIFKEYDKLNFVSKNIYCDQNITIIEFELTLNQNKLVGVDIIEWKDRVIKELRAYLY